MAVARAMTQPRGGAEIVAVGPAEPVGAAHTKPAATTTGEQGTDPAGARHDHGDDRDGDADEAAYAHCGTGRAGADVPRPAFEQDPARPGVAVWVSVLMVVASLAA
jgi:hypothetical protein